MHNVHTHAQRWCHCCSQASEQSSDTNVINRQIITDSTSNATIFQETIRQCVNACDNVLMHVNASDSTMCL